MMVSRNKWYLILLGSLIAEERFCKLQMNSLRPNISLMKKELLLIINFSFAFCNFISNMKVKNPRIYKHLQALYETCVMVIYCMPAKFKLI